MHRNPWIGRFACILLVGAVAWFAVPAQQPAHSQTASASGRGAGEELQIVSVMLPSGVQQLTILDVAGRTLAIYHVEPTAGKLQLKSVRRLAWDLQMEHFNGQSPLPSELRQVQP